MKLKRITFYIVDHEKISNGEIANIIEDVHYPNHCINPQQVMVEEVDIGKWDDSHRCNQSNYDLSKEFKNENLNTKRAYLLEQVNDLQDKIDKVGDMENLRKQLRVLQDRVRTHNIKISTMLEISPIVNDEDLA